MSADTEVLMLLRAPHLTAPHAFTTRAGGVSTGVFGAPRGAAASGGLNLDDREDDSRAVEENRRRLSAALGFSPASYARLTQVHGTDVITAQGPGLWTGDALVTDRAGVLLAIGTADCYPILFEDPQAGVIGAAHAGWKGTLGRIAAHTVQAMTRLGAAPERLKVAVGPGICGARYEVSPDVAGQFQQAGLGHAVLPNEGRVHLDLAAANRSVLREAGVPEGNVWLSGRCSTEEDFYSYRRDAGRTGRMWAVIGRAQPGEVPA
ncbi:laccase domain protein [Deinococcus malanensis]|uniref:Purine nucleoside phosphorylase n=1 Tax=Deinococcus malanensis TaxID=1706855 RepID=A0ABQ2EST4_9DEIO|nr:peptidoglycan editing factor PgeF [Deinococcus malanensis]GGK24667.1 laccase domain protein [Deinococcus malanensis]